MVDPVSLSSHTAKPGLIRSAYKLRYFCRVPRSCSSCKTITWLPALDRKGRETRKERGGRKRRTETPMLNHDEPEKQLIESRMAWLSRETVTGRFGLEPSRVWQARLPSACSRAFPSALLLFPILRQRGRVLRRITIFSLLNFITPWIDFVCIDRESNLEVIKSYLLERGGEERVSRLKIRNYKWMNLNRCK